jgi:hypothetical protein
MARPHVVAVASAVGEGMVVAVGDDVAGMDVAMVVGGTAVACDDSCC